MLIHIIYIKKYNDLYKNLHTKLVYKFAGINTGIRFVLPSFFFLLLPLSKILSLQTRACKFRNFCWNPKREIFTFLKVETEIILKYSNIIIRNQNFQVKIFKTRNLNFQLLNLKTRNRNLQVNNFKVQNRNFQ